MLHDTIPLDRPELVSQSGVRHHKRMVRSVARFAAGLIVTTTHAREAVLKALAAEGRSDIKTLSVALPLAEAFDSPTQPDPLLEKVPYFVVCGTVEPRRESFSPTQCLATSLCFADAGPSSCCRGFASLAGRMRYATKSLLARRRARKNPPCRGALYAGHEVPYCRIARSAVAVLRRGVRAANH